MAARPGRPRIGPTVKVPLPPDVVEALDRLAAARGMTRAALVRHIVTGSALVTDEMRGES